MGIESIIGAGASIIGGISQGKAAKKAAQAQTDAANADIAFQKETFDTIRSDLAPYRQGGSTAQEALLFELGLGSRPTIGGQAAQIETIQSAPQPFRPDPRANALGRYRGERGERGASYQPGGVNYSGPQQQPQQAGPATYRVNGQMFNSLEEAQAFANANKTGGTAYQGFQQTPGYQFQFDQGTAAVNALAGVRGGLDSGRTRQDLTAFGQGLANQEYGNYFNRLSNAAGNGMNAAALTGTAAQNQASGVSNALAGIGNAQSAGAIAQGNAFSNTANNLVGLYNYQRNVQPQARPTPGWTQGTLY